MKLSVVKDLTPLRDAAKAKIAKKVGEVRSLYLTVTPGQEMVYMEKERQADLYFADPLIDPEEIPEIVVEAERHGNSVFAAAQMIKGMAAFWRQTSPLIERKRLTANAAVDAAQTPASIEAATIIDWSDLPTPV